MYKLSAHSAGGNIVISSNPNYHITGISGLTPVNAEINSSRITGGDGSVFNSASVGARNIVLTLLPNQPVAANRQALYKVFAVKEKVTLKYSSPGRDIQIEGYVESVQADLFARRQQIQISILCMQPYFKSAEEIVNQLSTVEPAFEFPFETEVGSVGIVFSEIVLAKTAVISNAGDVPCGAIFRFVATGTVLNPVIRADNLTQFALAIEMQAGDEIVIDTQRGSKSVTLTRQGVRQNIINKRRSNVTWFQLPVGETTFAFDAESGLENLVLTIGHYNLYGGV